MGGAKLISSTGMKAREEIICELTIITKKKLIAMGRKRNITVTSTADLMIRQTKKYNQALSKIKDTLKIITEEDEQLLLNSKRLIN